GGAGVGGNGDLLLLHDLFLNRHLDLFLHDLFDGHLDLLLDGLDLGGTTCTVDAESAADDERRRTDRYRHDPPLPCGTLTVRVLRLLRGRVIRPLRSVVVPKGLIVLGVAVPSGFGAGVLGHFVCPFVWLLYVQYNTSSEVSTTFPKFLHHRGPTVYRQSPLLRAVHRSPPRTDALPRAEHAPSSSYTCRCGLPRYQPEPPLLASRARYRWAGHRALVYTLAGS